MKKATKSKFSPLEDKLIIKTVKDNPHNLQFAFEKVAKLLDNKRSAASIQQRYYGVIRKTTPLFAHVSRGGITINTKNVFRNDDNTLDKPNRITVDRLESIFNTLTPTQQTQFRNAIN